VLLSILRGTTSFSSEEPEILTNFQFAKAHQSWPDPTPTATSFLQLVGTAATPWLRFRKLCRSRMQHLLLSPFKVFAEKQILAARAKIVLGRCI
jgi:hypothetical protein